MKKGGFTLIELLVVIVVISILATLVVGGASYTVRVAREKRTAISCKTLETAIHRYHAQYNDWPGKKNAKPNTDGEIVYSGEENKNVFGALRAGNNDSAPKGNPKEITFIDETAFFTSHGDEAQKLSETTGLQPLVFVSRSGRWTKKSGDFFYYKVTINPEFQTVKVEAPGFNDEDDD